jgi:hypothetical protein
MLSSFQLPTDVTVEKREDRVGGAQLLGSDIYPMTVDMVYMDKSVGGAHCINFRFTGVTDNKIKHRETIYFTNKQGEPFYTDKKDASVKRPLPGFTQANEILLAICGKEMHEIESKTATIKIWDKTAKAEVPVQREVLVDLLKQQVNLGIIKQIVNKQIQNPGPGKAWIDDPTGEVREENVIRTAFRYEDCMSVAEMERGATEAAFHLKWIDNFQGKDIDKSKKVAGGAVAGAPGAPAGAATAPLQFD